MRRRVRRNSRSGATIPPADRATAKEAIKKRPRRRLNDARQAVRVQFCIDFQMSSRATRPWPDLPTAAGHKKGCVCRSGRGHRRCSAPAAPAPIALAAPMCGRDGRRPPAASNATAFAGGGAGGSDKTDASQCPCRIRAQAPKMSPPGPVRKRWCISWLKCAAAAAEIDALKAQTQFIASVARRNGRPSTLRGAAAQRKSALTRRQADLRATGFTTAPERRQRVHTLRVRTLPLGN